jgi:hypothetical protein
VVNPREGMITRVALEMRRKGWRPVTRAGWRPSHRTRTLHVWESDAKDMTVTLRVPPAGYAYGLLTIDQGMTSGFETILSAKVGCLDTVIELLVAYQIIGNQHTFAFRQGKRYGYHQAREEQKNG